LFFWPGWGSWWCYLVMGIFLSFDYLFAVTFSIVLIGGVVAILYRINKTIRRSFKETGDDRKIETEIEAGDTVHAEGIYGRRHPEEGGQPLDQEREHHRKHFIP